MHFTQSDEEYTEAVENHGQLRKRTRTPLVPLAPLLKETKNPELIIQSKLTTDFEMFRQSIKKASPNVQFDKVFVDRNLEAECLVSGICTGLRSLQSLESDRFNFFIEDGRLIIRYTGEPVPNSNKKFFMFIWIITLVFTIYFVITNLESYKRFLE